MPKLPQPELPEPAHPNVDSMLSRKFGKEVANYFSGMFMAFHFMAFCLDTYKPLAKADVFKAHH